MKRSDVDPMPQYFDRYINLDSLTRGGRKQLAKEAREWERATAILARFFAPAEES